MSGVFGIATKGQNAQDYAYFALYALQHRGQIGCGMAANKNGYIDYHKDVGVVSNIFNRRELKKLQSNLVLAAVNNAQTTIDPLDLDPIIMGNRTGSFAVTFDGALLNHNELCERYGLDQELTDAQLVAHLLADQKMGDIVQAIRRIVPLLEGAYVFSVLTHDVIIGVRDPYGVMMLSVGRLPDGHMIATESCTFECMGAELLQEVSPGNMVIVSENGIAEMPVVPQKDHKTCLFEVIYTSRPDSFITGHSVYTMRKAIGRQLAITSPQEGIDMVMASPDSGTVAAIGYAKQANLPFDIGIIKNRYIGRTFIEPDKELRDMAVQIKLNVIRDTVAGKSILIVDDSIVRGTTMRRVVAMLKEAGATQVHVRIASPLVKYPCKILVNPSIQKDLLADRYDVEGIRQMIGADSLAFLTIDDILEAIPNHELFCTGCLTNEYPILEDDNGTEL